MSRHRFSLPGSPSPESYSLRVTSALGKDGNPERVLLSPHEMPRAAPIPRSSPVMSVVVNQNRRASLIVAALVVAGMPLVLAACGAFTSIGIGRSAQEICAIRLPGSFVQDSHREVVPVVVVCVVAEFDVAYAVYAVELWSSIALAIGAGLLVIAVAMASRIRRRNRILLHTFSN